MASKNDKEYEDLRQFFTTGGWRDLSNYEKLRMQNMKRNYEMMIEIGLNVPMPDFMLHKRKPCRRRLLDDSDDDDDDDDWRPNKKVTTSAPLHQDKCKGHLVSQRRQANCKTQQQPPSASTVDHDAKEDTLEDLDGVDGKSKQAGKKRKNSKGKVSTTEQKRSYPKRNKTSICYEEEVVPDDDHFIYCEDCQEFNEASCPKHPLSVIEDNPVSLRSRQKARQSIPEGLSIKETSISGAGLGVFAEKFFSKGVRFGPYKGEVVKQEDAFGSGYAWEICSRGKPSHYIDAKNEAKSNWMRFVNCARDEKEQNLVAFQYLGQIYYRSFKPIPAGTELLVYYGKDYARDLGIERLFPDESKRSKLEDAGASSFACSECGHLFTIQLYLFKHLKYTHGKPIYFPRSTTSQRTMKGIMSTESLPTAAFFGKRCLTSNAETDAPNAMKTVTSAGGECRGASTQSAATCNLVYADTNNVGMKSGKLRRLTGKVKAIQSEFDETKEDEGHEGMEKPDTKFTKSAAYSGDAESVTFTKVKMSENSDGGYELWSSRSVGKTQKCDSIKTEFYNMLDTPVMEKPVISSGSKSKDKTILSGDKPYQYKTCGKPFSLSSNLKRHEKIHSGDKPHQCKTCGKSFSQSGALRSHERIHSGDKPYQCKTCGKSFSQSSHLRTHERIHSGDKPYQFKTCGKSFSQSSDLRTHERIHSGDKPYQCKTCGKSFSQSGALRSHERIHSGDKPYQCKTCGKSFSQSSDLRTHERIHSGDKPYQCKTCGKSFSRSSDLRTHERIHSGDKPYQCKTCGKSFSQSGALRRHERIHSGDKPYQCKTCGKSFSQSSDLRTHERIHSGDKPYQCKTCGKSFSRSSDLRTHERIHSGDKPYQCKTCGKSFSLSSNLRRHERIHSGDKPYQCKTCGKSFSQSSDLRTHERIHSGDKPYQCKTCGKSFSRSSDLRTHERIHSGDKPYQCKTCGKSFSQSGALRSHERIHSGDKPYQCKTCGKSFSRSSDLRTHERIHSGDKPYQCKTCGKSINDLDKMNEHAKFHEQMGNVSNMSIIQKQAKRMCEE